MGIKLLGTTFAVALLVASADNAGFAVGVTNNGQEPDVECSSTRTGMDTIDGSRRFMARFVEFINTASPAMAKELVSPAAIFHVPGRPEPAKGPEGYLEVIGMMRGGFPDIQWTIDEMVVEPTKVAARFTMRGTHRGPFFGVAPTGRRITVQALNIYHLCHGQIVTEYGQPDMMALLQQIGGVPPAK
jgi:predicted ester cyclase